jgi:hypothetical protein
VALPVAMVESSFRALLVTTVGAAPLPAPGSLAAGQAAIAVSAVTMHADEEHRATVGDRANTLTQNDFAMCRHVLPQAALDNGSGFVALLNQLGV